MRKAILSVFIYITMLEPVEFAEVCDVYEFYNLDGIEVFVCHDIEYEIVTEDRDREDAEPEPWGPVK